MLIIDLHTSKFLRKNRKYAAVIILILSGIIMPSTDVASQLLVFVPLYVLYEVSISMQKEVE